MLLDKQHTGLILVDVQGKLAEQMCDYPLLFDQLRALLKGAELLQLPIIWLEQLPDKLGATRDEIRDLLPGKPFNKNTFSGLQNEDVLAAIQNHKRSHWLVAGIEAHICVYQTVADLLQQKYEVHLVTDAVASRSQENKQLALNKMQKMGANLTSVEMALFELQKVAEGETFKEILKLIK